MTDIIDVLPRVLLALPDVLPSEQKGITHVAMPIPRLGERILIPGSIGLHNVTYEVLEVLYTPLHRDHAAIIIVKELFRANLSIEERIARLETITLYDDPVVQRLAEGLAKLKDSQ